MKKQQKVQMSIAVLCGIYLSVLAIVPELVLANGWIAAGKYLTTVYGIIALTCLVLSCFPLSKIISVWISCICRYLAAIIMIVYTILTLDTFVFHAMSWYPGILRYALYSAYGILYSAWILIGIVWYIGFQEVTQ